MFTKSINCTCFHYSNISFCLYNHFSETCRTSATRSSVRCSGHSRTVPSINSAYSLQILFNVAKVFIHITFSIYFFVVTLSTEFNALYIMYNLFVTLWSSIQLILIITCCDYTKRQVSVYEYCCLL